MNTFEHLKIDGFRRLFSAEVEMRPLTVMIGANGVGKSSFLEIFSQLYRSPIQVKSTCSSKLCSISAITID